MATRKSHCVHHVANPKVSVSDRDRDGSNKLAPVVADFALVTSAMTRFFGPAQRTLYGSSESFCFNSVAVTEADGFAGSLFFAAESSGLCVDI